MNVPGNHQGPVRQEFAPCAGNRFELLIDGERFFPRMLASIEEARQHILLEMYLFESGVVASGFIEALTRAARRGVAVKLLLDDFGALKLLRFDRQRLIGAGVTLVFYNPLHFGKLFENVARDHRKLLIVDGTLAFVGGAGITDEFNPPAHPSRRWRETMLAIEGPVVVQWQRLFATVWDRNAHEPLRLPPVVPLAHENGVAGCVAVAGPGEHGLTRALFRQIYGAKRRVWLCTAYFVPSIKLRRALRYAAHQGVDVRLLLPGFRTDHPAVRHAGRRFYGRLLHSGVRIFEYQPRVLHSKVTLCDDWATIGSSNFDRWSLRWNLEANQCVDDAGFAGEVARMFEADFADSVEYTHAGWLERPWHLRWREALWGMVEVWLGRVGGATLRRLRRRGPPR